MAHTDLCAAYKMLGLQPLDIPNWNQVQGIASEPPLPSVTPWEPSSVSKPYRQRKKAGKLIPKKVEVYCNIVFFTLFSLKYMINERLYTWDRNIGAKISY